ncbi:MAG: copper-containing nitrite reductase [Nitrospirota bacterium]|nr:copper-containing nitrite reductase [Nitrospirota bacterium]
MSIPFSRNVRNAGLISAFVIAPCLALTPGLVSAETIKAQVTHAPNVPPPITRNQAATVQVDLEATEFVGKLSDDNNYKFWGFNGTVPGPMVRVMVGDTVEVTLKNNKNSKESHNIDFHAVTGPGGGAAMLNTEPGQESKLRFKALNPGLYVYHCATASPSIPEHIANGMYGVILVEPVGGLPRVDKEYYVMQSEFYTKGSSDPARGHEGDIPKKGETLEFSFENGLAEHSSHVVYNGMAGSLVKNPLKAKVGDNVRIFFANAGPNHVASWHIIGEIFDKVWSEGSLTTAPLENVQTTLVPAAGSSMVEFKVEVPGTYLSVDHSIFRIAKGAVGLLKVDGPENPEIYKGLK